jgi:hypothetical protein
VPAYHYAERHELQVNAPPGRVYAAIRSVSASEIRFFHRRFAPYWRTILPGSSILRVTWLRAIARRAESESGDRPPASGTM